MNRYDFTTERQIKQAVAGFLSRYGWTAKTSELPNRLDVVAKRKGERWIIEVKSPVSPHAAMITDCFLEVLGKTIQRMDDPACKYSMALPDADPFHHLWARLPALVKRRMRLSVLFVGKDGSVFESPS